MKMSDIANPSRRKKSRKFRVCMRKLLALPVCDEAAVDELTAMGLDEGELNNYMLVTLTVFKKAVGGDLKFIQELRQMISDNETDLGRLTGVAQLDKLRAQTEEIRRKFASSDDGEGRFMADFLDVLSQSAQSLAGEDGASVTEGDDS